MCRNAALASSVVASMAIVWPLHQAGFAEALQHPGKQIPMRLEIDQPARPRDRRMIRRRLGEGEAQEVAERQRIRRAPRDGALRVQPFEVPDQQQPEVDPRRQPRPAHRLGVKRRAPRLGEVIKATVTQQLIQPRVKRMTGRRRQLGRRHPHGRLSIARSFAHRHGRQCSTRGEHFHHGLLDRRIRTELCGAIREPSHDVFATAAPRGESENQFFLFINAESSRPRSRIPVAPPVYSITNW